MSRSSGRGLLVRSVESVAFFKAPTVWNDGGIRLRGRKRDTGIVFRKTVASCHQTRIGLNPPGKNAG